VIRLTAEQQARMRRAAEDAWPLECCGLLVGSREDETIVVEAVEESANLSDRPADSFEIDMRLRLRLQKALRGTGRDVVGHYHSHPGGPAHPSARDLDQAWEPEMIWIILSVEDGRAGEPAAFRLAEDGQRFLPVPIDTVA
jgi:proteasome lid subunit RPN8/RPN11